MELGSSHCSLPGSLIDKRAHSDKGAGRVVGVACLGRVVPHPLRQALLGLLVAQGQLRCRVQCCVRIIPESVKACLTVVYGQHRSNYKAKVLPWLHMPPCMQAAKLCPSRPACCCHARLLTAVDHTSQPHTCWGVARRHIVPSDHVHLGGFVLGIRSTLCWLLRPTSRGFLARLWLSRAGLGLCWAGLACSACLGGVWGHAGVCFLQPHTVQRCV